MGNQWDYNQKFVCTYMVDNYYPIKLSTMDTIGYHNINDQNGLEFGNLDCSLTWLDRIKLLHRWFKLLQTLHTKHSSEAEVLYVSRITFTAEANLTWLEKHKSSTPNEKNLSHEFVGTVVTCHHNVKPRLHNAFDLKKWWFFIFIS